MTIRITNPYQIARLKHFAALRGQAAQEYAEETVYGMLDAEEYDDRFIPTKEELEAALAAV
jgi:hypothetical protein